jgi:hypothetical protein
VILASLLVCPLAAQAQQRDEHATSKSPNGPGTAAVDIAVSFPHRDELADITFNFIRDDATQNRLILTAVNFGSAGRSLGVPGLEPGILKGNPGFLAGWFVLQNKQELWLGVSIEPGEYRKSLNLKLPILFSTSVSPPRSELMIAPPLPTLRALISSDAKLLFAEIQSISAAVPAWGSIDEKQSVGWQRRSATMFEFAPKWDRSKIEIARLAIVPDSSVLNQFLQDGLWRFAGGFGVILALFLGLLGTKGVLTIGARVFLLAISLSLFVLVLISMTLDSLTFSTTVIAQGHLWGGALGAGMLGVLPGRLVKRVNTVLRETPSIGSYLPSSS